MCVCICICWCEGVEDVMAEGEVGVTEGGPARTPHAGGCLPQGEIRGRGHRAPRLWARHESQARKPKMILFINVLFLCCCWFSACFVFNFINFYFPPLIPVSSVSGWCSGQTPPLEGGACPLHRIVVNICCYSCVVEVVFWVSRPPTHHL